MQTADLPIDDPNAALVERLTFALQAAEVGTWDFNLETGYAEWSPICKRLFGLPPMAPASAAILLAQVHPEDQEWVNRANRNALDPTGDGQHDITFRTVGPDGRQRWVHAKGKTITNSQGKVLRFSGIAQDVTANVDARQQLKTNQERFRSLIEEAPVATCLFVGRELVIEVANEVMLGYWGKGAAVLGQPLAEAIPELQGQPFLNILDQVFITGETYTAEGMPAELEVDGTLGTYYFNFTYKPLRNEAGAVYAIMNMAVDVTQSVLAHQQMEQAQLILRQSEARQTFLLGLSDRIRLLDNPADIQYQAARFLGEYLGANRVGYAEDQGDGVTIVVTRNYVKDVPNLEGRFQYVDFGPTLLADFLAGSTVVRADIANDPTLSPEEKEAHRQLQLGATVNKPLLKDGRLLAVMFIHYQQAHNWSADELTLLEETAERTWAAVERARAEGALRESEERYRTLSADLDEQVRQRTEELEVTVLGLQRSNDNLQQFAYVASHDLQEPLRKIHSFGDILKNQYAEVLGDGVGYLDRMQSAANRMSTLIRDLLMYSRISARQEITESVPLTEVVQSVLTDLELALEETSAQLHIEPLPTISGDKSQLGQLFQNLLSNALKFRRPGVTPDIRIQAALVPGDQLPSSLKPVRPAGAYHQIMVSDNGIGFEDKYADRIFQVFQRLHGKSSYAGTGIGLAICEKVVSNHGGGITASSQPGQGATFHIYLPHQPGDHGTNG